MFTGLVKNTTKIEKIDVAGEGKRIKIKNKPLLEKAKQGESISVSGACLTVEEKNKHTTTFFLAEETLKKTWFSQLQKEDLVNLEDSLTPEDKMGGHYVQGHVDTTAEIKEIETLKEGWNFKFSKTESLEKYIVKKGFITIEGISLTITKVESNSFSVTIIPETWKKTNLSEKQKKDLVNVEADVMAKYAQKAK